MKRMFWFVVGFTAGVFGSRYVKSKAKSAASQMSPSQVASDLYDGALWLVNQGVEFVNNMRSDINESEQSNEGQVYINRE